jgi:hypothetical protein
MGSVTRPADEQSGYPLSGGGFMGGSWMRSRGHAQNAQPNESTTETPDLRSQPDRPATRSAADASPPEQPFVLVAGRSPKRARLGEVLPARRTRAHLPLPALPRIPKRAILAVGIAAGLAAPAIARQLLLRSLPGLVADSPRLLPSRALEAASVEIIRVTAVSPHPGRAGDLVGTLLERVGRG